MKKIWILLFLFAAQQLAAQQPQPTGIRVADTLTAAEKSQRNRVILRAELDSMLREQIAAQPRDIPKEQPVEKGSNANILLLAGGLLLLAVLLGTLLFFSLRNQRLLGSALTLLRDAAKKEPAPAEPLNGKGKQLARGTASRPLELQAEMNKLQKENEGLNRVIREYNGIQHEYDTLKQGMLKAYKVRNYPGYDRGKKEHSALQTVLQTEYEVAAFAWEKLLKPVFAIADANKNHPAKISPADQEKLLDGLLSLSLLYIEYLYLRVNELAIGGKMVERIQGIGKGKEPDTGLLRALDTSMGSRALVIRMLLDKIRVGKLSYPVFDETNLNPQ